MNKFPAFQNMSAKELSEFDMKCADPGCTELKDSRYADFCSLHEKAISDARDEYDRSFEDSEDSDRSALDYSDMIELDA